MKQLQRMMVMMLAVLCINLGCDVSPATTNPSTTSHTVPPADSSTFHTESGATLDSSFYELDENETLVAKVVLKAGESQHLTIMTNEPLSVGFRVPFGIDGEKKLKFNIDGNHQFPGMPPMNFAARLQESKAVPGTTPTAIESLFGGSLTLTPIDGAINIDLISKMDEPMEFLVYTEKPDNQ